MVSMYIVSYTFYYVFVQRILLDWLYRKKFHKVINKKLLFWLRIRVNTMSIIFIVSRINIFENLKGYKISLEISNEKVFFCYKGLKIYWKNSGTIVIWQDTDCTTSTGLPYYCFWRNQVWLLFDSANPYLKAIFMKKCCQLQRSRDIKKVLKYILRCQTHHIKGR